MPKILVITAFPFAVDGNEVVQVEEGEQDVSDRCAVVAVDHLGYATLLDDQDGSEIDPHKMNVSALRTWLTGRDISFDPSAKKPELLALVPSDD